MTDSDCVFKCRKHARDNGISDAGYRTMGLCKQCCGLTWRKCSIAGFDPGPPACHPKTGPQRGRCPMARCAPCPDGFNCRPVTEYFSIGNDCCAKPCKRTLTKKSCPDGDQGWGLCSAETRPTDTQNYNRSEKWVESESSCCKEVIWTKKSPSVEEGGATSPDGATAASSKGESEGATATSPGATATSPGATATSPGATAASSKEESEASQLVEGIDDSMLFFAGLGLLLLMSMKK